MKNPLWKLLAYFSLIYWIQGVLGSYRTFEERYLSIRYDKSLSDYAYSQNLYSAAWFIKPVYGWLTDNINPCGLGFRRPYIFVGALIGGVSFAILPSLSPVGAIWHAYLFIVFCRSFGIALADAAVDGLLIDASVGDWGSIAQGFMSGSRTLGELVATTGGAAIAGKDVNPDTWYFLSAGVLIAVPFAFAVKEERHAKEPFSFRGLRVMLSRPILMITAWNVASQIGNRISSLPLTRWAAREHGFGPDEIGYMASVGLVLQMFGNAVMGWSLDRYNRRALLFAESSLYVLSNIIQIFVASKEGVWAFWLFNSFADGMQLVALNRMTFLFGPRECPALFLAVNSMIGHASTMIGNSIAGYVADNTSIRTCFIVGAVVTSVMLLPIWWITDPGNDPITAKLAAQAAAAEETARLAAEGAGAGEGGGDSGDGGASPLAAPGPLVVVSNPVRSADKLSVLLGGGGGSLDPSFDAGGSSPPPPPPLPAAAAGESEAHARRRHVAEETTARLASLAAARQDSLTTAPGPRAPLPPPPPPVAVGNPFSGLAAALTSSGSSNHSHSSRHLLAPSPGGPGAADDYLDGGSGGAVHTAAGGGRQPAR